MLHSSRVGIVGGSGKWWGEELWARCELKETATTGCVEERRRGWNGTENGFGI